MNYNKIMAFRRLLNYIYEDLPMQISLVITGGLYVKRKMRAL